MHYLTLTLGGTMDFKKYGKAISKDIEAAGITAQVKFAPSRALT